MCEKTERKSDSGIVESMGSVSLYGEESSENYSENSSSNECSSEAEPPYIVVCLSKVNIRGRTRSRRVTQPNSRSSSDESRADGTRSASETSSVGRLRRMTAASFRRVVKSLALLRSHSLGLKNDKEPAASRSILRAPVSYTYVRGLSGLPTQRVPRQRGLLMSGLNR